MNKIFLLPILIFMSVIAVKGQTKIGVVDNKVTVVTEDKKTEVTVNDWASIKELLRSFGEDCETMATDTPPKDSTKTETIQITTIESDSGDMVEIIVKDGNGNVKKVVRINEDLFDDYNFDFGSNNIFSDKKKLKTKRAPKNKNVETDWFALDIGLNGLMYDGSPSLPSSLSNLELDPLKSVHVNVGIFQQKINLYKHHVGFVYGINYDNNDYRFSNDIDFRVTDNGDSISYQSRTSTGFKRNKLTTRFLTVPVALRFDFNPKKKRGGHITIGAQAGYRLTSFFKTVRQEGGKRKDKVRDDFLLNNFRYGAFVKIGYGRLNVFGSYIFTPLFRENTAPEFNTFSFGLSFGGF